MKFGVSCRYKESAQLMKTTGDALRLLILELLLYPSILADFVKAGA